MKNDAAASQVTAEQVVGRPAADGRFDFNVTCKYSEKCPSKQYACNGEGCPICDGKSIPWRFSCATARWFKLEELHTANEKVEVPK